ncbi:uncharacterized protein PgNI_07003 [Pyricularia grisea]|uniref:Uncharacterized protein n=1 Tax=Pyricularia grisea TaxID=148305 RepID=A0A6P8B290_PYRGI|nr:uncharacterized protein PgNI_07003 [Pyricularia grisea]TLD08919.1 hypothetical protein PgNI_07003 [Pyricularia grisea]
MDGWVLGWSRRGPGGCRCSFSSVYLTLSRGCTISHERSVGICTIVEYPVSREGKPVRKGVVWQVGTSGKYFCLFVDSRLVPAVGGEKSPSASCRPRVQEWGCWFIKSRQVGAGLDCRSEPWNLGRGTLVATVEANRRLGGVFCQCRYDGLEYYGVSCMSGVARMLLECGQVGIGFISSLASRDWRILPACA